MCLNKYVSNEKWEWISPMAHKKTQNGTKQKINKTQIDFVMVSFNHGDVSGQQRAFPSPMSLAPFGAQHLHDAMQFTNQLALFESGHELASSLSLCGIAMKMFMLKLDIKYQVYPFSLPPSSARLHHFQLWLNERMYTNASTNYQTVDSIETEINYNCHLRTNKQNNKKNYFMCVCVCEGVSDCMTDGHERRTVCSTRKLSMLDDFLCSFIVYTMHDYMTAWANKWINHFCHIL